MKYFQKKTGGKHEMKKKIVSMLLVAAMVASMAVGCGSKNDSGNSDTKSDKGESITFMAPDWAIPSDDQLDEFTKETGIEVEVSEVGWDDIREKLATAATGNKNVADVVEVDWSWVGEFKAAGWLEPLKISDADKEDFLTLDTFTVDDEILALPYSNDYRIAYYNKDQFAKAGINEAPKTYAEVLEDAKALKMIYPNTEIILYYGASELNYITYVTGQQMNEKRNLIGKAFPSVTVELKKDEFYIDTAYHVEGITTPYTLHDTGYCDTEGNFYFTGRKDDILNIRGRKISALKVENAFLQIDEVKEAAVKVRTHHSETILEAYVEAKEDFLERYRQKWHNELKKVLASYEIPRCIYVRKQLPKNDSGKIIKDKLHPDSKKEEKK